MFWIEMARYERTRSTGKASAAVDTMTLVSFYNDSSTMTWDRYLFASCWDHLSCAWSRGARSPKRIKERKRPLSSTLRSQN